MQLPAGDFHAWVGCESAIAKALRAHLVGERGANPKWTRASGYWRRGAVASARHARRVMRVFQCGTSAGPEAAALRLGLLISNSSGIASTVMIIMIAKSSR